MDAEIFWKNVMHILKEKKISQEVLCDGKSWYITYSLPAFFVSVRNESHDFIHFFIDKSNAA